MGTRAAIVAVLCCWMVASKPVISSSGGSQGLKEVDGLRLAREIMTVQMNAPFAKQHGDLADLLDAKLIPELDSAERVDASTAIYRAYKLVVTKSSDGSRFQMALAPVRGCGPAWFGTEASIIYVGKALGCK